VTIRLYLDEDAMDRQLVRALRARGIDVQTVNEAAMVYRTDLEQLQYATSQSRVIYSFNIPDYCRLHAEWAANRQSHAGIVVSWQKRYGVGEQMRRLLNLCAAKTADEMRDQLEFLSDWAS
jgi:DNA-binding transcriptional MerR regulator